MMQCSFLYQEEAIQEFDVARGYTVVGDDLAEIPKGTSVLEAFGSMYSTANDSAAWLMMHTNNGRINNRQFFAEGLMWEVRNPFIIISTNNFANGKRLLVNYGLGWEFFNYNNTEVICQGGAYYGFLSMMGFIPEQKTGFVILTNSDSHVLTKALRLSIIDVLSCLPLNDYSINLLNHIRDQKNQMQKQEQQLVYSSALQILLSLPAHHFTGI